MRRPDQDPPLYVPAEFEAEHLADARRTVILSAMRRNGSSSLAGRGIDMPRRRAVALLAHLAALTIALVFSAVTGTWVAGIVVLVVVSGSLGVTLWVISHVERQQADRRQRRRD
jgi:fatty acid desaturase